MLNPAIDQHDQGRCQISSIIKKTDAAGVDGFEGYEDGVEGHDRPAGAGLIQGTLAKFSNSAAWVTRDDEEISSDLELVAVDIVRVTQRWVDGQPVETKILEPGEKFPDVEVLNEALPRSEWAEGPDGKLRGPWQNQSVLYLVDLATMEKYTYPTGTTGGSIAIRELKDKLIWMRRMRGPNVYPVVLLSDTFMNTRFGGRQRPLFKIVRWVRLGGGGGDVEALPAPTPAPEVQAPSVAEDMNDSVDDIGTEEPTPPKKPAVKASAKAAPNRKRVSTLEAG